MVNTSPQSSRLNSLTGYRFILALIVLCTHIFILAGLYSYDVIEDVDTLATMIAAGTVSSFFMLSGFVLTWNSRSGDRAQTFWRRRIVKIFPNHVVTWGLMLLLLAVTTARSPLPITQDPTFGEALRNLFLVHTWSPDFRAISSLNGSSWSIACEVFFYLVFPFIIGPLRHLPAHRLWLAIGAVVALIVAMPLVVMATVSGGGVPFALGMSLDAWWLLYFFPVVRLLEFVLGILVARTVQTGRWPALKLRWPLLGLVAVMAALPLLPTEYVHGAATCVPLAALIALIASRDIAGRKTWLSNRVLVRLGEASYALYLIHIPVVFILRNMVGPTKMYDPLVATLIGIGMVVAAIAASLALFHLVESPMMRRFSRPRRPTQHPVQAEPTPLVPSGS